MYKLAVLAVFLTGCAQTSPDLHTAMRKYGSPCDILKQATHDIWFFCADPHPDAGALEHADILYCIRCANWVAHNVKCTPECQLIDP